MSFEKLRAADENLTKQIERVEYLIKQGFRGPRDQALEQATFNFGYALGVVETKRKLEETLKLALEALELRPCGGPQAWTLAQAKILVEAKRVIRKLLETEKRGDENDA